MRLELVVSVVSVFFVILLMIKRWWVDAVIASLVVIKEVLFHNDYKGMIIVLIAILLAPRSIIFNSMLKWLKE